MVMVAARGFILRAPFFLKPFPLPRVEEDMRRSLWCWLSFLLLTIPGVGIAVEPFTDELEAAAYDCAVTLTPAKTGAARITLETDAGGQRGIRVTLIRQAVRIEGKGENRRINLPVPLTPGEACRLQLLRRDTDLYLLLNEARVTRVTVPRGPGGFGAVAADAGWRVGELRAQRLEPVVFADNFMRTANESGGWTVRSGRWGLLSAWDRDPKGGYLRFKTVEYAQNPFAWAGSAELHPAPPGSAGVPTGTAICTAGQPHWEDYTFTVAVCPPAGGAAGVLVNMPDPDRGLLVRWSPVNDRSPTGDRLRLYRVAGEKRELLAEARGGYLPGQWYKLAVTSTLEGVTVSIDNRERLAAKAVAPWRGGVGLYAEGAGDTMFDDVTVYGRGLQRDLLDEHHTVQLSARYQQDEKGMAEWAASANDWLPHPAAPALRLHRWEYFGDHRLSLTLTPAGDGALELILNGDGADAAGGVHARVVQAGDTLSCALRHGGKMLATQTLPALEAKTAYGVRLRREGGRVTLELDGETILAANAPADGLRPAYRAEGAFAVSDVAVVGRQVLDETFADAPADWLSDGTWMPTTRWACSPQWSFLGGEPRRRRPLAQNALHRRPVLRGVPGAEDGIPARARNLRAPFSRSRGHHLRRRAGPAQRVCRRLRAGRHAHRAAAQRRRGGGGEWRRPLLEPGGPHGLVRPGAAQARRARRAGDQPQNGAHLHRSAPP